MERVPAGHFRKLAGRLAAVVLLAAVLAATLVSGRSFSWCPFPDALCAERCVAAQAGPAEPSPTADAPGHPERPFGELPDAGRRHTPRSASAAPLALLPAVPAVAIPRFLTVPALRAVRAGVLRAPPRAGPHSAAARCVSLQVFHC